jgi:hypothetical protein
MTSKTAVNQTQPLLHTGHCLRRNNFFNLLYLAAFLRGSEVNIAGLLRLNRKHVLVCKLQKGEIVTQESNSGVVINRNDKHDAAMMPHFITQT